jgi:hypothetical protein
MSCAAGQERSAFYFRTPNAKTVDDRYCSPGRNTVDGKFG